jgi:hypothetical protein
MVAGGHIKQFAVFPINLNAPLSYNPVTTLLDIYSRKMKTYAHKFIAVLSTIAPN